MRTFPKYKQNLRMMGNDVWSYTTIVARQDGEDLKQLYIRGVYVTNDWLNCEGDQVYGYASRALINAIIYQLER